MGITAALPPGLRLAHPTCEDAAAVTAFCNARDIACYGVGETALDDVLANWGELDLGCNAWLCCDTAGAVVGYATTSPAGDRVNCKCCTLPAPAWAALSEAMLRLATERAVAIAAANPALQPVAFTLQPSVHPQARQAALTCGYHLTGHHFAMQIDLDEAPPAPVWPEGIVLRTMRPDEDAHSLHALLEECLARPHRPAQSFETWQDYMMRADLFRPDRWFIAEDVGVLAGLALCFGFADAGWVAQLAVAEGWRRRGLATALLRHAFGVFYQAGKPVVGLRIWSHNEQALRLYHRVGMRCVRQLDHYECDLAAFSQGEQPR